MVIILILLLQVLFVYPIWMDNSTGNYQLWSTQVININFPLNNFHLNDPGSGQIFTSSYKAQDSIKFEWDTSATGAIYRFSVRDTATNQFDFRSIVIEEFLLH